MPSNRLAHAGIIVNAWHWLEKHLGPVDEFSRLSQDDLREMSSDLNITVTDLYAAANSTADSTDELTQMMVATGLDPKWVEQNFRTIMRDIQVTCVRCPNRTVCARELSAGRAGATYHAFCGNAETFDEINHDKELRETGPHQPM